MANKTVSNLNELTTVSNSDVLLVETATETMKVTKENLLKEVNEQLNAKSNANHTHNEYVTENELNNKGLATETFVTNKIAEASLSGGEVDLSDYATKEYVNIKVTENTDKITVLSDEVVEIEKELTATRKLVTGELVDLEGVLLENAPDYLKIPTYDGSDQIVHCKVLYFKNKWNGYKFWMGHTPLPYIPSVDESKENPCIMVSDDGENWLTPQGLTNPLDLPTNYPNDYLSDTHLVYIPHTDTLEIWYRQYIKSPTTEVIWRRTSKDGVNWTEKEEVMRSNSTNSIVSPTVIYDENKYKIWFVGNTSAGYELRYFESDNGLNPIHIRDMNIGNLNLGHCDVIKTTKGYECVCHIRGDQSCVYSYSEDNLNWSSCTEILKVSNSWDNNKLYRPSLTVVDNQYYFYYAGGLSTQGAKIGLIKVDGEGGLLAKNIIQDEDNMFLNKTLYNKLANLDVDDILNRLVLLEKASSDGVIRVQGVTLDVKTHSIGLNETIQLNPAIMPPDATNQTIIWSASNDNCSVDNGVVTAKAPGVCVITAKTQDGGYTDSCDILVSESADGSFQDSLILHLDSTIKGDVVGHWMDLSPKQQTVLLENFTNDGINDGFIDGALKLNDQALTRIKIKEIKDHFKKDLTLHIKYNAEKTIGKIFGNNFMTTSSCAVPNTKVVYWRGNKSYEPQGASFEVGVDTEFTITHNVTSGELKIYKDKMNIFTGTLPSTDSLTTGDLYIGASDIQHGATNHFKGKIYSVKMFNTVLTPEEVQSL